jgi:DedD protein
MGLFSIFSKKNRIGGESVRGADQPLNSDYRESRFGADEPASRKRSARKGNSNEAMDPVLPEKKRARRRLIGAAALLLAVIIGLPVLFDSKPAPASNEIAIDIPAQSRQADAPESMASATDSASSTAASDNQSATSRTGRIDGAPPAPSLPPGVQGVAPLKPEAATSSALAPEPGSGERERPTPTPPAFRLSQQQADKAIAPTHIAAKPSLDPDATQTLKKIEPAAVAPKESEKNSVSDQNAHSTDDGDAARAMAILEGRTSAAGSAPATANKAAHPTETVSKGKVSVQVAAVASEKNAEELVTRLKAAGLTPYTQKVTANGSVRIRVRIGPYPNRAEAEQARAKLTGMGLSGSIAD